MKNIIFDWSGVVKDAVAGQLWIVNKIFEKCGINKITLEEFQENWEQPYNIFYRKYLSPEVISDIERENAYREAIFNKDCPKSPAVSGIVDVIKKLKSKNCFLAVVSSDLKETLYEEIKDFDLEDVFNEIVTDSYDKTEAVREIVGRNNLSLPDTFFVGDSNHEIDVSKTIGIKSIAVTWGYTSEKKLKSKHPDFIVKNPKELKALLING
ncbi:MAG TPA: HAD family hydrolase [Candidatus Paceibacterota bacterium]|nr:HAD family hydrolase [Candidatus Paceibacterota bacterium]